MEAKQRIQTFPPEMHKEISRTYVSKNHVLIYFKW